MESIRVIESLYINILYVAATRQEMTVYNSRPGLRRLPCTCKSADHKKKLVSVFHGVREDPRVYF